MRLQDFAGRRSAVLLPNGEDDRIVLKEFKVEEVRERVISERTMAAMEVEAVERKPKLRRRRREDRRVELSLWLALFFSSLR